VNTQPNGSSVTSEECRDWVGHVIVCGLNPVGLRTVEQLHLAGARVAVLDDEQDGRLVRVVRGWGIPHLPRSAHLSDPLYAAGISGARAVVCAELTDLRTLETVLLIRDLRPDVLVVADLDNPAVAHAVEEVLSSVGVLDVAALFAPAVVEACLSHRAREILLGDTLFVAAEVIAPSDGTLREIYGHLAPIGVVTEADDELIAFPGRDQEVSKGDRVTLLGTRAELDEAGLGPRLSQTGARSLRARTGASLTRLWRNVLETADAPLRIALALGIVLLIISSLVLHFGYRESDGHSGLPLLDAAYFTVETIATVGYGDYNFSAQPKGMEIFGIALIVAGTTLVTTLFALLTNALVSRRIAQSLGRGRIPGMRDHVVIVGLGAVGMQVLQGLLAEGREVVVVERTDSNEYLAQARSMEVPVVIGDATLAGTLEAVNMASAAAVAILTSDDLTNIETGLAVRDRLGERWTEVPVVLRVFDRQLGHRLQQSFGFRHVWSTSAIAAPWFVGAALGLEVLFTFYPGKIRVAAIRRAAGLRGLEHPPRRDTTLAADDDAYLVGPYAELLEVLRHDRDGTRPTASVAE
jgi:Trk K+ transport system NAD-binding subunit